MNQRMSSRKLALVIATLIAMAVTSRAQQRVLKLVEVTKEPPCSTWGDITSCAPNGGAVTWAGSYNTTYTWTVPPNEIGPGGASITLSVSQSNPSERRVSTGLRMTGSGFVFNPANADVAIGGRDQPLSGSASVSVRPDNPSGDCYLKIGVYYGPAFVYHYRAEAPAKSSPNTGGSTSPIRVSGSNEVKVVELTEDGQYHKAGSAAGAWLPIEHDTILKAGDEITTGPGGSVTLAFNDGSTVTLSNLTQLKIASLFVENGVVRTEILLKMGEVQSKVSKQFQDQIPKSDFRIKTPTDVSSVRGTVFTVRYDSQTQISTTLVAEGVVQVTPVNPRLRPLTLNAGQRVQVSQNRVGEVTSTAEEDAVVAKANKLRETLGTLYGSDSVNISGRWSGSWTNSRGESGQSTINISDAGGAITGDEAGWKIENGHRSGNILTWEYRNQNKGCRDYSVRFEISADGKSGTGTYTVNDRCEQKTYTGSYFNYHR